MPPYSCCKSKARLPSFLSSTRSEPTLPSPSTHTRPAHHCRPAILPSAMHLGLPTASATAGNRVAEEDTVIQPSSMYSTPSRTWGSRGSGAGTGGGGEGWRWVEHGQPFMLAGIPWRVLPG